MIRPFRYWYRWFAAGVIAEDVAIAVVVTPWWWPHVVVIAVGLGLFDRLLGP